MTRAPAGRSRPGPFVGTSGFSYKHWIGVLYPRGLPQARWLEHYVRFFNTVELNSTFYHLPRPGSVDGWRERAPRDFVYAVKASRYLTHIRRLRNIEEPLARFYGVIERLEGTLGPILFQLPPSSPRNDALLDGFLPRLSRDHVHVLEFRHRSWFVPEVLGRLDRAGVSACSVSSPGLRTGVLAAGPILYLRFHGAATLFGSRYAAPTLLRWAEAAQREAAASGRPIYAYFNNDAHGHAVRNARQMARYLGLPARDDPVRARPRSSRSAPDAGEGAGRSP
jgi:uncharacterized protein YecE (DUF72 family)